MMAHERTGKESPRYAKTSSNGVGSGAFIETDLVDPRYYSKANIKNRIESYLQMITQRRGEQTASALRRQ